MRVAFGKTIVRLAERDDRIVLLTGDVVQEMAEFRERWPDRCYNLGITEQSIIGVAAGLAIEGMRPGGLFPDPVSCWRGRSRP